MYVYACSIILITKYNYECLLIIVYFQMHYGRDRLKELLLSYVHQENPSSKCRVDLCDSLLARRCVITHVYPSAQKMPEPFTNIDYRNDWPHMDMCCDDCHQFCYGDIIDFLIFQRDCEGILRMLQIFEMTGHFPGIVTDMFPRLSTFAQRQRDFRYYPTNLRFDGFDDDQVYI